MMRHIRDLGIVAEAGLELQAGPWSYGCADWRVASPRADDGTSLVVAELHWVRPDRRWTLDLLPTLGLPPRTRVWLDPDSDRPRRVPIWLEAAVLDQAGSWAVQAARDLLWRQVALISLVGDLAAELRVDRDSRPELESATLADPGWLHDELAVAAAGRADLLRRADEAVECLVSATAEGRVTTGSVRGPAKRSRTATRKAAIAAAVAVLEVEGVCWTEWARSHDVSLLAVRNVVRGRHPCERGAVRRAAELILDEGSRPTGKPAGAGLRAGR